MCTEVVNEFEYNSDVDDSRFVISLPENYQLVDRRPTKSEGTFDLENADLVLTPREGIGPIRFGMSRVKVIELLGEPDSTEVIKDGGVTTFEELLKNPDFAESHETIRKDIERLKRTTDNTDFLNSMTAGE